MQIKRGSEVIADVHVKKNSYTLEEINGVHTAYIEFDVLNPVEFTINDYIEYYGNTYYIRYKESISKIETSLGYSYKMTLYHDLYRMHDTILFMYDQPDFNKNHNYFRGTVSRVLDLIVLSMNRNGSGWTKGVVIESETTTFDLKDKTCAEVLQNIINEFNTEYWVEGKVINVGKREYSSNGLVLAQTAGFRNLTLEAVDDTPPVTRLFAYGSDANLTKDYGCDYLMLPDGKKYLEKNVDKYGVIEHIKQFEDIYPHGIFTVTEKIDNFTLRASDIDFNLTDQLIDDVEVIVTFQEGSQLAGYDLAIVKGTWNNTYKQFRLAQNEEENALDVPGDINFNVGDKFILTGLKMPDSYIHEAEQKLREKAQKWLDGKCENRIQLRGDCDEIYFYENNISLSCGQMVGIYNEKLKIDREIRIIAVKRYIENDDEIPYNYDITISDYLQGSGLSRIINEIKEIPNQIERESNKNKQFTKRAFRDAIELGNALQEAFDNFSKGIDPVFVRTMQLVTGDERLQYRFVNSKTNPVEIDHSFTWDQETRTFAARSEVLPGGYGIVQHMTLGIDSMKPSHTVNEYKFWDAAPFILQIPDTNPRWLYLRCSKTTQAATFKLSETPIEMESEAGYYHFIVGYLNSEYDNDRSFATLYGFTEVLPGQIRVNKIISNDGTNFWDMVSKMFKIGSDDSYVSWNVDKANQLAIKGTIMQSGTKVQNPNGETDFIGIDRGTWVSGVTYYPGDMVKHNGNVYKCILQNTGVAPTNTSYWKLMISKGEDGTPGTPGKDGTPGQNGQNGKDGTPGQGYMYAYYASDLPTYTGRPSTPGVIPSGWTASPDFNGKKYIYVSQCIQANGVWGQWTTAKIYSVYPEPGDPGPAVVFRGEWSQIAAPKIFYNNAARRDVVQFGGTYWIYKGTDGATATNFDYSKWDPFGAQFSSVATDLLYTPNGNVGGWIFQNEKMVSQTGNTYLNGKTGEVSITGKFATGDDGNKIVIDPTSQTIRMYTGNNIVAEMSFANDSGTTTSKIVMNSYAGGQVVSKLELIPHQGVILTSTDGLGSAALTHYSLIFDLDTFPKSHTDVGFGGLYRDGNTIKIRT